MTEKEESNHSAEAGAVRSLQETPTWALAIVCFVFIAVSIFLERLISLLSTVSTKICIYMYIESYFFYKIMFYSSLSSYNFLYSLARVTFNLLWSCIYIVERINSVKGNK